MDILTLLHLMNAGQTPQQNPAYGITQKVDTTDGGKVYNYYDQNGNPVTDPDLLKAYGKYGGSPYKPMTGLAAAFNPTTANYVSQQNNAQFQADVERGIRRHITGEDLRTLPTNLYAAPSLPLAANITLNAGGTTAPQLESARQATEMINASIPQATATEAGARAFAGTQESLYNTELAERARGRLPTIANTADIEASNRLFETQGEKRRLNLKDILANNRLGAETSNALLADELASNRLNYIDQLKATDKNAILTDLYRSGIIPPSVYPYGTAITPQGTFIPGTRDPNFVSALKMKMAGFGDESTGPAIGPTIGKGVALPIMNPTEFGADRQPINNRAGALPSIGAPVASSMPKGTNINNVSIGTHLPPKATSTLAPIQKSDILGIDNAKLNSLIKGIGGGISSFGTDFGKRFLTEIMGVAPEGYHWEQDSKGNRVMVKNK